MGHLHGASGLSVATSNACSVASPESEAANGPSVWPPVLLPSHEKHLLDQAKVLGLHNPVDATIL